MFNHYIRLSYSGGELFIMDILQTIVLTLEDIEVHGSENMSKLLGCIQALNEFINQQESAPNEEDGGNS